MRLITIALALLLCAPSFVSHAADDEKPKPATSLDELDKRIGKIFSDARIPGASVSIIENNQIVFTKGYGSSDLKTKKPVTPETVFRAGSISKSFTSIGVMMLVEEGKLSLDMKLADLLPELKYENEWEATHPIRLVHLLEHTTGFDDIQFRHYLLTGKDIPLSQSIDLYGPYKSRWKPGTRTSYCNAGPVIAGRIIEKVSGQNFQQFMASRLTTPLAMESAHWTLESAIKDRISKSYSAEGAKEEPFMDIVGRPSGSLNITSRDLARLPLLMLGRGTLDGKTYLQQASVDRIERPESNDGAKAGLKLGYGLGNFATVTPKTIFHGHDGGIDGFASKYEYAPSLGAGFVVMVNLGKSESLDAAAEIRNYLERSLPEAKVVGKAETRSELEKYTGIYVGATPRQQDLALLFSMFDWAQVTVEDGQLVYNKVKRVHLGNGLFQRVDRAAPTMVFVDTPDGMMLYTSTAADRQMPMWEMGWKLAFVAAAALALVLSALYMLLWIPSAFMGRLRERGGISIRFFPWAALVSVIAFAGLMLYVASAGSIDMLATPSPVNWALYGASLLIPAFGIVSLLRSAIGSSDASVMVRFIAWLNSIVVLGFAAYMYSYGWIGMKLWE